MQVPSDARVRFPELRDRLRRAVGALTDSELQDRLWVRGERWSAHELGFNDALLVVVDELEAFGVDIVGDVLVDTDELQAFTSLVGAINRLIGAIGNAGTYADAVASPEWAPAIGAAGDLKPLLGGWCQTGSTEAPVAPEVAVRPLMSIGQGTGLVS